MSLLSLRRLSTWSPSTQGCLERVRRCSHAGAGVSLGAGSEVSKDSLGFPSVVGNVNSQLLQNHTRLPATRLPIMIVTDLSL